MLNRGTPARAFWVLLLSSMLIFFKSYGDDCSKWFGEPRDPISRSGLLSPHHEKILADERQWLRRLQVALVRYDVDRESLARLDRSIQQLDDIFLIAVVGEFNAGKSAVINALLGDRILEEGATPTTTMIQIVKHGEPARTRNANVDIITAPVEILRDLHIVDTPGTNAIFRGHEALTLDFIPRSDIVLFITSADRPFTESERAFMQNIREWGKKIVFVINKVDILQNDKEIDQVVQFVRQHAHPLLDRDVIIFPISAKDTLGSRLDPNFVTSGRANKFSDLEKYIFKTLDNDQRIRLKFLNPIGVGTRLVDQTLEGIDGRLEALKADMQTLEEIDGQFKIYREDMLRDFNLRIPEITRALDKLQERGLAFLDETVRLSRAWELIQKDRYRDSFERTVINDTPKVVDQQVKSAIDWMVESDLRQRQILLERIQRRQTARDLRITNDLSVLQQDRLRLLETVGRASNEAIETYDKKVESEKVANQIRSAVAGTAIAELGALGLGTAVGVVASTALADVTGFFTASAVAALGLYILPRQKAVAKKSLVQKVKLLKTELAESLTNQFRQELDRSVDRLKGTLAPYSQFVRHENEKLQALREEILEAKAGLNTVRKSLE